MRPIADRADVHRIRALLRDTPRDLLLFELLIQTGASLRSILGLKAGDLARSRVGDEMPIMSGLWKNAPRSAMTETIFEALRRHIEANALGDEDHLFRSRKGSGVLNVSSVSELVKKWFAAAGLEGLFGVKSLRKTWAVHYQDRPPPDDAPPDRGLARPTFDPVSVLTLQETVYKELYRAIVSGRVRPGARLTVAQIAEEMKVSPITVREALLKLEGAGFITSQRKRGFTVNELSINNVKEIYEMRMLLDVMAAEKACARRGPETVEKLKFLMNEYELCSRRRDRESLYEVHNEFHQCLYQDCHQPMVLNVIKLLMEKLSPYLTMVISEYEDLDPKIGIRYHRKMMEAMVEQDPVKLCKWLKSDFRVAVKRLEKFLAGGEVDRGTESLKDRITIDYENSATTARKAEISGVER